MLSYCPRILLRSFRSGLEKRLLYPSTSVSKLNSFHGRASSVLKTKFFIPISSDETGTTSGAKASANHLAPSSSSSSPGHATQWPTFLLRPPGYGVQVVWPLFPTASAVSRWAVSSNTEGEGRLNLTSLLSVAYHVTLNYDRTLKMNEVLQALKRLGIFFLPHHKQVNSHPTETTFVSLLLCFETVCK